MSAPASAASRVLAQARFEALGLLRNGEQLLVSLVLPLLVLLGLALTSAPALAVGAWAGEARIDVVLPGVLALAVISTAFTGQAILLGFERRYGVLRLLGTTPLGRGGLLAGKALAVLTVLTMQVLLLGGAGLALGWHADPLGLLIAVPVLLLGAAVFVALAALLGGALRAEAVLALANFVWVLLLALGGVLRPMPFTAYLPSAALGDALRSTLTGTGPLLQPVLVLVVWGVAAGVAAGRWLRWSD